ACLADPRHHRFAELYPDPGHARPRNLPRHDPRLAHQAERPASPRSVLMNLSRNSAIALGLVLLVTVASIPLWANQGWVFIAGVILIESLFCLSWNLLFGFAGLATFGHAAFF